MKKIIKMRWFIAILWIIVLALSVVYSPDLNKILRAQGQQYISNDEPSAKADAIIKEMDKTQGNSDIIVFNSASALTESNLNNIKAGVNNIKTHEKKLGVSSLMDPFNMPDIKSKLISKDNKTIMVTFKLSKNGREISDIRKEFQNELKNIHTSYYLTGSDFISDDYMRVISSGVDKSAVLTVIFILIVLIIMFRSVITPLISLFAVGISYFISAAIVGFLANNFGYPISSLTQIVLVLILFGIGTDYNILLFNRFKEELSKDVPIDDAIVNTYKTAGKTIAFSVITVFAAFLSLSMAKFSIYRSGNCVAFAVIVLLLEILTFTPFLMKLLGTKLFWPSKKITNHKPNKFWETAASISVKRPVLFTVLTLLIIVPAICFNVQKYSFDTVNELGNSVDSVKGFNLITDKFGKGEALTTTIAIENDTPMDNNASLATIDNLTKKIRKIKGVKSVSSATEPLSDPIDLLYIGNQSKTAADGVSKLKNGVDTINNGIDQIDGNLNSFNTADMSKVNALVSGTGQVQDGLNAVENGLQQVNTGISQGAAGADKINSGITEAKDGMTKITAYTKQITDGVAAIQDNYQKLGNVYKPILAGASSLKTKTQDMNILVQAMAQDSKFNTDPRFQGIEQYSSGIQSGTDNLYSGLSQFKQNYDLLTNKLTDVETNLNSVNSAQNNIIDGLSQLQTGSSALTDGLKKGTDGQTAIIQNMSKLNSGLTQIKNGQEQLNSSLTKLSASMPALKNALTQSSSGLSAVSDGLSKTNSYLAQLGSSDSFFVPDDVLNSSSISQALDAYMTKDRKITKLTVVLAYDPYSADAMNTTKEINAAIPGILNNTPLKNAKYGVAGTSATDYDINNVAKDDLNTMKVIVLASVFLILLFVIRSPFISLYICAALFSAYYISSTAINFIVFNIFKYDGVSWNMPFFSFVMIVALGVDYSIFLMMRFKEYKDIPKNEAIVLASKYIGGVILSAALILGGTFITMIPAGVRLLTQLALAVAIGLVALSVFLLPIFLPSLIALPDAIKKYFNKKDNAKGKDKLTA